MDLRRSAMKRLMRHAVRKPDRFPAISRLLNVIGFETHPVAAIEDHAASVLAPVSGPSVSLVTRPRIFPHPPETSRARLPAIHPLLFEDARVRADTSIIDAGKRLLLPRMVVEDQKRLSLVHGENVTDVEGHYMMRLRRLEDVPIGICAFGSGATNWYHWLIEILPIVMLARALEPRWRDVPLLVPREILKISNFRATLELFSEGRPIVPLNVGRTYRVDRLIYIPPPVFGPIHMRTGCWPEPADYRQNMDVMTRFRAEVLDQLGIRPGDGAGGRVFLSRSLGKRPYNAAEIERIAVDAGFDLVFPERLTFREQVQMMHDADCVVGPTGAAWANALFMRPGSRSLVWAMEAWGGACVFSNLALVSGSDMAYLTPPSVEAVNSITDAQTKRFHLPARDFSKALGRMLAPSQPVLG